MYSNIPTLNKEGLENCKIYPKPEVGNILIENIYDKPINITLLGSIDDFDCIMLFPYSVEGVISQNLERIKSEKKIKNEKK